jgi:hypothetical protein
MRASHARSGCAARTRNRTRGLCGPPTVPDLRSWFIACGWSLVVSDPTKRNAQGPTIKSSRTTNRLPYPAAGPATPGLVTSGSSARCKDISRAGRAVSACISSSPGCTALHEYCSHLHLLAGHRFARRSDTSRRAAPRTSSRSGFACTCSCSSVLGYYRNSIRLTSDVNYVFD